MPILQSSVIERAPFRLLGLGHILLIAVTWPLWTSQTLFPQVPLLKLARECPPILEWLLLITVLSSLSVVCFAYQLNRLQWACFIAGLCNLGLIFIDQHRLQPWTWEFVIVSFVLAFADSSNARRCWRWLVIGIYAWSAWSKIDYGFCLQHGPFLLDGICKSLHLPAGTLAWPNTIRFGVSSAIPLFELLVALGLCWRKTVRLALIGAAMMHIGLLLALGPWGHNHKPGVLVWNLFFMVQNWILFRRQESTSLSTEQDDQESVRTSRQGTNLGWGNLSARAIVCAALVWPLFEPFGLCDHWPAWAVYAAKPERVSILLSKDDIAELPRKLNPYCTIDPDSDDWYLLRIDRWSLDSLNAPIYPQDRFQVGIALDLIQKFGLEQVQIIIEGPANRWTGQRSVRRYEGVEAINQLAHSYRINAQPRHR